MLYSKAPYDSIVDLCVCGEQASPPPCMMPIYNRGNRWPLPAAVRRVVRMLALLLTVAAGVGTGARVLHDAGSMLPAPTCTSTNTTFLALTDVCIHSDHLGLCGTAGADTMNVGLKTADECRALCCAHRGICAGFLWYAAYKTKTDNCTAGGPCCWLKSAIAPAERWSNDPYCSAAGVVHVPGPL